MINLKERTRNLHMQPLVTKDLQGPKPDSLFWITHRNDSRASYGHKVWHPPLWRNEHVSNWGDWTTEGAVLDGGLFAEKAASGEKEWDMKRWIPLRGPIILWPATRLCRQACVDNLCCTTVLVASENKVAVSAPPRASKTRERKRLSHLYFCLCLHVCLPLSLSLPLSICLSLVQAVPQLLNLSLVFFFSFFFLFWDHPPVLLLLLLDSLRLFIYIVVTIIFLFFFVALALM